MIPPLPPIPALPSFEDLCELARVVMKFGRVNRLTRDDAYLPESDTTHSLMLAFLCLEFSRHEITPLDRGLVLAYAIVHDLPEVYAGDTPTLIPLTPEQQIDKDAREANARKQLRAELAAFPRILKIMDDYEAQADSESRFVKVMDKITPKLTHTLNGFVVPQALGETSATLAEKLKNQAERLRQHSPGLLVAHHLYAKTSEGVIREFPEAVDQQQAAGLLDQIDKAIAAFSEYKPPPKALPRKNIHPALASAWLTDAEIDNATARAQQAGNLYNWKVYGNPREGTGVIVFPYSETFEPTEDLKKMAIQVIKNHYSDLFWSSKHTTMIRIGTAIILVLYQDCEFLTNIDGEFEAWIDVDIFEAAPHSVSISPTTSGKSHDPVMPTGSAFYTNNPELYHPREAIRIALVTEKARSLLGLPTAYCYPTWSNETGKLDHYRIECGTPKERILAYGKTEESTWIAAIEAHHA